MGDGEIELAAIASDGDPAELVYNVRVDGARTYLVGEAGVSVHNK